MLVYIQIYQQQCGDNEKYNDDQNRTDIVKCRRRQTQQKTSAEAAAKIHGRSA